MNQITKEKLKKYISITKKAIEKAEKSDNRTDLIKEREDWIDYKIFFCRRYSSICKLVPYCIDYSDFS